MNKAKKRKYYSILCCLFLTITIASFNNQSSFASGPDNKKGLSKRCSEFLTSIFGRRSKSVTNDAAPTHQARTLWLTESLDPSGVPFLQHTGPGAFDNALALNIPYGPIRDLRTQIEQNLGKTLDYLKSWNPTGEAHVTTITPPEYANILSRVLTMRDIEEIAIANQIQHADVLVLGVGFGSKMINGQLEETFFVIVDSQKLRHIRNQIWQLFVKKGGDPRAWDPTWFFPHITIGYTKQDIHEPDVIKNIRGSLDSRFILQSP